MSAKGKEFLESITNMAIKETAYNPFTITYKNGRGHFTIYTIGLFDYNLKDFQKIVNIIEMADDKETVAAYVNMQIKAVFNEVSKCIDAMEVRSDEDRKFKEEVIKYQTKMVKLHKILAKNIDIAPLVEVVNDEPEIEANENITELKKCNVVRYIPTQVSPIWENGTLNTFIGYNFSYRGMPLQVYRSDGWENRTSKCTRVFIVDPVIGLPIYQYDGMLSDLESKLDECFIKYLATIESNKEAIVQIASAFKKLKEAA